MLILNGIDPDWKATLSQETTDYLLLYLSDKFKKELTEEQLQFTVFNSGHFRIIEKVNVKVNSSSWVLETPSVYWLEQGTKYYGGYAWSSFAPLTPDKHGIIYKAEKKGESKNEE